jgi:3alpha(or 20beta)-hydroxysteroid dehydrogenase
MFSLKGKVAVITGGASGIGKASALRFSKAGAKVVLADIQDAGDVAKEVGGIYVRTDVTKEGEVKALMEKTVSECGKLDIVCNNVGVDFGAPIEEMKEEDFDRIMNINAKSVLWGVKHAAPRMSDGGSIINTSSLAGLIGFPEYTAYCSSKFAIVGISKTAALELAPRRIRVNCVCPGSVDTPMMQVESAQAELALVPYLYPLGRMSTAEEIAALFHYLASDESAIMTGLAIPIDGGYSAGFGLQLIEPLLGPE